MAISDTRLEEFIAIYETLRGVRLPPDEARPIAERLMTYCRLLMRPPSPPPAEAQDASEAA
jgi:hypothetical protein